MKTTYLRELPAALDPSFRDKDFERGVEPFFACPIGEQLWREYHALHPQSPERPPVGSEDDPDAKSKPIRYWDHVDTCDNCNE